jgi:hypothetical protein
MQNYAPPLFDMPKGVELHASRVVATLASTVMDVLALSVVPGILLACMWGTLVYFTNQSELDLQHAGINSLAAIALGCTRVCFTDKS